MRLYQSQQLQRIQNADDLTIVCGVPLLPLATGSCTEGPCTVLRSSAEFKDIVGEALEIFRFTILLKNRFDIHSPADKVLVYLILWIQKLIRAACKSPVSSRDELANVLKIASKEETCVPGDANFPLNMLFAPAMNAKERTLCARYLEHLRLETARRLVFKLWDEESKTLSKWWTQYLEVNWMGFSSNN